MKTQVKNKATLALYKLLIKGYTVNKSGQLIQPNGEPFKERIGTGGYFVASIRLKTTSTPIFIHRFVAFCKFGAKIFQNDCVRHLDGNPLNNSWSNIALGSDSDNQMDIPLHKRQTRCINAIKANTKYDAQRVRELHNEGKSYTDIMLIMGIKSKSTINNILK